MVKPTSAHRKHTRTLCRRRGYVLWWAGILIDVHLEVVIVPEEAAALLVDGVVREVFLRQQQLVLAHVDLHLQLRRLLVDLRQALRVDVRPVTCTQTQQVFHRAKTISD